MRIPTGSGRKQPESGDKIRFRDVALAGAMALGVAGGFAWASHSKEVNSERAAARRDAITAEYVKDGFKTGSSSYVDEYPDYGGDYLVDISDIRAGQCALDGLTATVKQDQAGNITDVVDYRIEKPGQSQLSVTVQSSAEVSC